MRNTVAMLAATAILWHSGPAIAAPGTQGLPPCTEDTGMPAVVRILPQDPAAAGAAFAPSWQGKWGGQLPSRLVVEAVDGGHVLLLYTWGDLATLNTRRGWSRWWAPVQDGKLEVDAGNSVTFRFALSEDGQVLRGERVAPNNTTPIEMTRCQP